MRDSLYLAPEQRIRRHTQRNIQDRSRNTRYEKGGWSDVLETEKNRAARKLAPAIPVVALRQAFMVQASALEDEVSDHKVSDHRAKGIDGNLSKSPAVQPGPSGPRQAAGVSTDDVPQMGGTLLFSGDEGLPWLSFAAVAAQQREEQRRGARVIRLFFKSLAAVWFSCLFMVLATLTAFYFLQGS